VGKNILLVLALTIIFTALWVLGDKYQAELIKHQKYGAMVLVSALFSTLLVAMWGRVNRDD